MRDWDDEFANMAYVRGAEHLPKIWENDARAYRATARIEEGIAYGQGARQQFDLVQPEGQAKGLVILVHGGYWMRFSRSDFSHLAAGAVARGWAVAVLGYTLAPQARLSAITREIAAATIVAASQIPGPIRLTGHSAGGHLVARLICSDTKLPGEILSRIVHTMPIGGLFDLRPLQKTALNQTLRLDDAEAHGESPALHRPKGTPDVTVWVGAEERPEFLRQSRLFTTMWQGLDAKMHLIEDIGHNHFSEIEGLTRPDSPITDTLLR